MLDKSTINYRLYLVTDRGVLGDRDLLKSIERAIEGGVTLVQLREKNLSTYDFYSLAHEVKAITRKHNVPLIINDRIDIALAVDADGVHLGPEDLPVLKAREILGPHKVIGFSANHVTEALKAQKEGADYLGIGALFPTKTKNNTEQVTLHALKEIKTSTNIPVVGIGGISKTNAPKVIETGVDGIAVVSAILGQDHITEAAKGLYGLFSIDPSHHQD